MALCSSHTTPTTSRCATSASSTRTISIPDADDYLGPEAQARVEIDKQLAAAGWVVQRYKQINLGVGTGVAVREFPMAEGHGDADYLLFVDRKAVGVIEAKKKGSTLTGVEWQSAKYTTGLPDNVPALTKPLAFAYESTGVETRFTNAFDPEPASRQVFTFHRPETLAAWVRVWSESGGVERATFRQRLRALPAPTPAGLWPAQEVAIRNLEVSLTHFRPRALIQMATGSGKTFTAANISYRLIKLADASRILFLVDRANLGRQTLKEFQAFTTPDDGRKFTELYNVQHLQTNAIDKPSRVVITTIQRLYSILRGDREMAPELDETSAFDLEPAAPVEITYNSQVPIEMFDVIIVDECHRSIYGVWRQVLDYFDASIVGLTATPGKQTFAFFDQNMVMEYNHEQAVADGVNVDFDVYRIDTQISGQGSKVDAGLVTKFRDRQTREVRLEKLDADVEYDQKVLDRKVVAKDQIRTIIRSFRERLPEIFPGRDHVPKTLIFAKDDSHADDIVQIVREEFGKGNDFAAKITYKSGSQGQRPEDLLASFRNSYNPRIAVTVDMIATGTDVKPLECVFFMRMVRSRNFFEQMKGRGVRVINPTDLQGVTPDAPAKDRFVIVDAVGVTEADLHDTVPLEREPTTPFDKLLQRLAYGERDPNLISSVAARIARLDKRITKEDRAELEESTGARLSDLAHVLVDALDPDRHLAEAQTATGSDEPTPDDVAHAATELIDAAVRPFDNPDLRTKLIEIRRSYEQLIDEASKDLVVQAGFSVDAADRARRTIESFQQFIEEHKDEITALQVLYSRPYQQRLTFNDIKELTNAIGRPPHRFTPEKVWQAYETLDRSKVRGSPGRVLTNIVSLVRFTLHQDDVLVPFPDVVHERFDAWMTEQDSSGRPFSDEQRIWLERIRDHIAASLTITVDDFETVPFVQHGGLGRAFELFGVELSPLLHELTEVLAA
ncbi:MAG TPA: type I restriction-modification enzyme R subunit C-terminal domain-containing protein [Acidimicrobiales bacterium]|nr:type I restriction-modification enzyme R subunit C-terminal domain-containing protein [Acidimicrobiales bacterium]